MDTAVRLRSGIHRLQLIQLKALLQTAKLAYNRQTPLFLSATEWHFPLFYLPLDNLFPMEPISSKKFTSSFYMRLLHKTKNILFINNEIISCVWNMVYIRLLSNNVLFCLVVLCFQNCSILLVDHSFFCTPQMQPPKWHFL